MRRTAFRAGRSPALFGLSLAAALATGALACSPPPELPSSHLSFRLVIDRTVLKFVRSFDLRVFDASLSGGKTALTCDDFPTTYSVDDTKLKQYQRKQRSWAGKPEEAEFKLRVPSDTRLVFVVRGIGQNARGTHVVLRGCADNQSFDEGSDNPISIDAYATLGAPCTDSKDCEKGLTCLSTAAFPGGYCTIPSCSSDAQCPPGGKCIRGGSSGSVCARICENTSDCKPISVQGYSCESRTPASGSCTTTCLLPTFASNDKCDS